MGRLCILAKCGSDFKKRHLGCGTILRKFQIIHFGVTFFCRFKGGFVEDPLEDDFIDDFRQVHVPMVEKVQRSVEVPQVQHGSAVGVVCGRNHG